MPRSRGPRSHPEAARRRAGRAFDPAHAPTIERVLALLTPDLGRWLALGLALLTVAMLEELSSINLELLRRKTPDANG